MMELNKIYLGDCLTTIKTFPDNCVDSIVTDPPYELGFMGKSWDNTGIANNVDLWRECLRILKPGGHLLSFSGTRTYHRMASAIEDAGFEVRDMIEWVYGSGFPKSLNISKQLEKQGYIEEAKEWNGRGTSAKPAHEPICMARKPLSEKTIAENCLKWGTGGINIDESRVALAGEWDKGTMGTFRKAYDDPNKTYDGTKGNVSFGGDKLRADRDVVEKYGRFPANLIHDNSEEVRECFPDNVKGEIGRAGRKSGGNYEASSYKVGVVTEIGFKDNGSASRFFKSILYYPKASKSERNKGCEEIEKGCFHPTVKPIALMEYLIKMVTKEGGIVLDPFAGSGTTLVAAKKNGYQYIGCELTEEYIPIIEARLNATDKPF